MQNFLGDLTVDEATGAVFIRERPLARFLGIQISSFQNLKASLLRDRQQRKIELEALAQSGFHLTDKDSPWVNDYQIGWLCQYYSKASRVSQEVRDHNSRLAAAFTAVGVRIRRLRKVTR